MKKLLCIMLVLLVSGFHFINAFADTNSVGLSSINIRPKHTETLAGSDSLYYGYVDLSESFKPNVLNYTATVDFSVSNVKVEVNVLGNCTVSGNKEYDLKVGKNNISLEVILPDGNKKIYSITISREMNPDDNNSLKFISIVDTSKGNDEVELSPGFDPNVLSYHGKVENQVSKINISAIDNNDHFLGGDYALKAGDNVIKIPVISKNGQEKTYTLNISREKSSDNTFLFMNINEYTAKKAKVRVEEVNYNPNTTSYALNVSYDIASIGVGMARLDDSSTVSGLENYNLKVGANKINISITSENGMKKIYTVNVNRAKPTTKLESLYLNEYFCGTEQNKYTLDVNYSTTKVNIKAVPENQSAKVSGNGTYNLKLGTNKFTVTVKSADGKVKKYPVEINRLKQKTINVLIIWTIK